MFVLSDEVQSTSHMVICFMDYYYLLNLLNEENDHYKCSFTLFIKKENQIVRLKSSGINLEMNKHTNEVMLEGQSHKDVVELLGHLHIPNNANEDEMYEILIDFCKK